VNDLVVNLAASAIAGVTVWLSQRSVRVRRLARLRAFLGVAAGSSCVLAVSRHAASSHSMSVHRRDLAAVVEVATLLRQCGASADVLVSDADLRGVGETTEFCIGGPSTNQRTAAHLRRFVPGLVANSYDVDPDGLTIHLAGREYRRVPGVKEFVLIFRIPIVVGARRPLWIIYGQTARSNHAAARYLNVESRILARRFRRQAGFCLALKVVNPTTYDHHYAELVDEFDEAQFVEPVAPLNQGDA
jgi:hypothetical protein